MAKVNIILTNMLTEASKKEITAIDPKSVNLIDINELSRREYRGDVGGGGRWWVTVRHASPTSRSAAARA